MTRLRSVCIYKLNSAKDRWNLIGIDVIRRSSTLSHSHHHRRRHRTHQVFQSESLCAICDFLYILARSNTTRTFSHPTSSSIPRVYYIYIRWECARVMEILFYVRWSQSPPPRAVATEAIKTSYKLPINRAHLYGALARGGRWSVVQCGGGDQLPYRQLRIFAHFYVMIARRQLREKGLGRAQLVCVRLRTAHWWKNKCARRHHYYM